MDQVFNNLGMLLLMDVPSKYHDKFQKFYENVKFKWFLAALAKGHITEEYPIPAYYNYILDPDNSDLSKFYRDTGVIVGANFPLFPVVCLKETNPKKLRISRSQDERLRKLYTGPPEDFEKIRYRLMYTYLILGGRGNMMGIPPRLFKTPLIMNIFANRVHELFGGPANTCTESYSSAFPSEVKYFQSCGSFEVFDPIMFTRFYHFNGFNERLLIAPTLMHFTHMYSFDPRSLMGPCLITVNPPFDTALYKHAMKLCDLWIKTYPFVVVLMVMPCGIIRSELGTQMFNYWSGQDGQDGKYVDIWDDDKLIDYDDPRMPIYNSYSEIKLVKSMPFYDYFREVEADVVKSAIYVRSAYPIFSHNLTARSFLREWKRPHDS